MRSTLIVDNPRVKVNLWHLDRMRHRAVKVKALVEVLLALLAVGNVGPIHVLQVNPVPAGRELDVNFQLCEID